MNLKCETLTDAITIVTNSGVVDWYWGEDHDPSVVLDELAIYLYQKCETNEIITEERFNEILKNFIVEVLCHDPSDYSL